MFNFKEYEANAYHRTISDSIPLHRYMYETTCTFQPQYITNKANPPARQSVWLIYVVLLSSCDEKWSWLYTICWYKLHEFKDLNLKL